MAMAGSVESGKNDDQAKKPGSLDQVGQDTILLDNGQAIMKMK